MSSDNIAAIARDLAHAMKARARTRLAEDAKLVLDLQTRLVAAVNAEELEAQECRSEGVME